MPGRRTPRPDPYHSQRQVKLVINHDQVPLRFNFILPGQFHHRHAAQVHVGFRLGQQDLFVSKPGPGRQRLAVPVIAHHTALLGNPVNREKADIVGRELVLDTRISQPNDQLHRGYFFAGGAFSVSAPSSVSCLPFLMTSGSAGPAAAASAVASGVATTSSFTAVTCATPWSSGVMNLILPACGRSFTRSTTPNSSAETSASMWL